MNSQIARLKPSLPEKIGSVQRRSTPMTPDDMDQHCKHTCGTNAQVVMSESTLPPQSTERPCKRRNRHTHPRATHTTPDDQSEDFIPFLPDQFRPSPDTNEGFEHTHCSCIGGGTNFGQFCLNDRAPGHTLCESCLEPRYHIRFPDGALLCQCICASCYQPPTPPQESSTSESSNHSHSSTESKPETVQPPLGVTNSSVSDSQQPASVTHTSTYAPGERDSNATNAQAECYSDSEPQRRGSMTTHYHIITRRGSSDGDP